MPDTSPCPLCGKMVPSFERHPSADAEIVQCRTCGRFAIEGIVLITWSSQKKDKLYHLSALTKYSRTLVMIDRELIKRLDDGGFVDPPIRQKLETIVRWVADQSKEIGQKIVMQPAHLYPIATCRSESEWRVLVDQTIKIGHLDGNTEEASVAFKGWEWLTERPNATSSTAFIAMSFAENLKPLKEAIFKAITAAGYRPVRVDEEEYVGGVMDEVVASIRESRFVVADFTGNRGGVYYEAGFASGLGIKVFQVCSQLQLDSKDDADRLHFDVHHLNSVPWKTGELDDFSTRLTNRILAVLGRGPLITQAA